MFFLDCEDVPDYEKKRLENIDSKKQFFNAQLQNTISALKAKTPKPFQCDKCPSGFVSVHVLNRHKCSYCEICKKNFRQYTGFVNHNRTVHGKELKVEKDDHKPKREVKKLIKSLDKKSLKYRTIEIEKQKQHGTRENPSGCLNKREYVLDTISVKVVRK